MLAIDKNTLSEENNVGALISNVLVPVDFSKRCARTASFAVDLARHFQAKVTLLNVEKPFEDDPFWNRETMRWAREQLASFLPEFARDPNVRRIVDMYPNIANGILRFAYEDDVNLIVMPTHGYGRIRRAMLGSVTAAVLRGAPCPVWTSSHAGLGLITKQLKPERILCAVNSVTEDYGSVAEDSRALSWASRVASEVGAKLYVAWSRRGLSETHEEVDRLERTYQISAEVVTDGEEIPGALRRVATDMHADLMVVGRDLRRSLEEPGLDMYQVVRESPCPVVSM
jgi:nucleotide-binding universal stress UspA family protein